MTFHNKGKKSNAKVIMHRLPNEEGSDLLYFLTDRQVQGLLQTITYLRWMTRHSELPESLNSPILLNDWVDELEKRLMFPYDPMQNICEAIINCIQNNQGTKDAITNMLIDNDVFNQYINNGKPLTSSELTQNLSENTECDRDILWAQCTQIVEYTHSAILDLLEILEVQFNNFELMQNLELIPLIGTAIDELQLDQMLDFINYMQEMVTEQYNSGYTETIPDGLKWEMVESLFCLCIDDCVITIDRIIESYGNLLSPYTAVNWDNVSELIETVIGVNDNSAIVPIVMHNVAWAAVRFTGFIISARVTVEVLKIVLKLAENDANNDWETLAECSPDTPLISFIGTFGSSYDGNPQTFVENTPTGGSTWDLTFQQISGVTAVAVTAVNSSSNPICVKIVSTTNVVSYQHNLCAGGAETGTIENPTTEYGPNLGWFGSSHGTVMRVTVEPV